MTWTVIGLLHIVIGIAASVHILFHKSNIRASISWIGVVWLSPFLGWALYYAFGINRVARKALRQKRSKYFSDKSAEFETLEVSFTSEVAREIANIGNEISDYPIVGGNGLKILECGDEAYPDMLAAINQARKSIALSMYIFKIDSTGQSFVDALSAAKNRGVEVRVLVDGIGSGYLFSPTINHLRAKGLNACRFMHGWSPWHLSFINLRNHKKLMIVDGKLGFVGGLNLSSANTLTKLRKRQINDTHFCFSGPIVAQLMTSFAEDWHFTTGEQLTPKIWWPELGHTGNVSARAVNSGPDEDIGKIETILAVAISSAKHHIRIVTPYFLPDERLQFLIELAALRGIAIDLIVPEKSDFFLVDHAVRGHLANMELGKINCALSSGPFDHSKLVTVDGVWCALGSPNWDVRSMRLNFEILVESYDPKTVAAIDRIIDGKLKTTRRLLTAELNARSRLAKCRDACFRLLVPYL